VPWLVTLSKHKHWTFGVSGVLIALSFVNMYYIAPRIRNVECNPDNPTACEDTSKISKFLLWTSAGIYIMGFLVAFVLGPILTRLDR
jgi:hypothetical protein